MKQNNSTTTNVLCLRIAVKPQGGRAGSPPNLQITDVTKRKVIARLREMSFASSEVQRLPDSYDLDRITCAGPGRIRSCYGLSSPMRCNDARGRQLNATTIFET
ncbi:hypothetical protein EVAR_18996_1 [Eumeta japonica]|uniref:Uncharacterized protein n=1 Tax=Eumeta variegata TaxID=151549 RepID=A0A4C1VAC1_EUMVA|nr:hypothetical protein EVAR_18996_1 [Eumeta japonica]